MIIARPAGRTPFTICRNACPSGSGTVHGEGSSGWPPHAPVHREVPLIVCVYLPVAELDVTPRSIMACVQGEQLSGIARAAQEALGSRRTEAVHELARSVSVLNEMTFDVRTMDWVLLPLTGLAAKRWEILAPRSGEDWAYVRDDEGRVVMAVDEPSEDGTRDLAAAVFYPELHTRMVSWWLVRAWRGIDLLQDTIDNLQRWRITSGAVTARALLEEAGSLADEARKLADGWKAAKAAPSDPLKRPKAVRDALAPVLLKAGFGSRIKGSPENLQATGVTTLINKLAKLSGDDRIPNWYDWLSDAAHPAAGARIAFASPPITDGSKAMMLRWYARSPLLLHNGAGRETLEPTIAFAVADALVASGSVIADVLDQSLAVVDDMGLTTRAATLTQRSYWRNLSPVRGKRACPCGRGPASACKHRWGESAPTVTIPDAA